MQLFEDDEPTAGLSPDERIIQRARKRWQRCKSWQGEADNWWRQDTKFANADARNAYQWPDRLYTTRSEEDRPCLTINKTRTHNRIIINESLQNKASIKVRPTGGKASYEAAMVMQAIIDRIEYISKATIVYKTAIQHQVEGGIGYARIETAYVDDKSFDQDIYIRRVKDPCSVYLDPDIRELDGSDANFGFEFERMPREKFNKKYPKYKDDVGLSTLGNDENWLTDDHILVAMYYERTGKKDVLVTYTEPSTGETFTGHKSEIEPDLFKSIVKQIQKGELKGRIRDVITQDVKWYLIAGDNIVDRGDWAGRYIPICRLPGEEIIIDGKLDRKGMTRYLIDPQRMLNYNASGQVEFGALQNKVPYVGPARAFEGQEEWKDANRKNYAFLQYNDIDDEAPEGLQKIEPPQRQTPIQGAPIYALGMKDAQEQMMMASGQYQAQMGENENAKSGKAINERQRQGDIATYDFVDNQYDFYRFIGMQIIDLIPKIYDTERILHIRGEDGVRRQIKIDPHATDAVQELKEETEEAAQIVFNPAVGEYEVMSDPGPNYATQRQEAWNAISIILQQNMQLASVIGDLLFKFGDFPGADEIMERLKKEIQATKPYLFSEDQDPNMMAMQQQMKKLTALNGELMQKMAEMQLKIRGKEELRDIEAFRAETDRMAGEVKALKELMLTPKDHAMMEHDLVKRSHDSIATMIEDANQSSLSTGVEEPQQ